MGLEHIIAPAESSWDHFFFAGPTVSEDFMAERVPGLLPENSLD